MDFIGIENFRAIKDYQFFEFKPITLLTGPNNSGKSSVLKAILLLNDNLQTKPLPVELKVNEKILKINELFSIPNINSNNNEISFFIPITEPYNSDFAIYYFSLFLKYNISRDCNLMSYSINGMNVRDESAKVKELVKVNILEKTYEFIIDIPTFYKSYKDKPIGNSIAPLFIINYNDSNNSEHQEHLLSLELDILESISDLFCGKLEDFGETENYRFYWELFQTDFDYILNKNLNLTNHLKLDSVLSKHNIMKIELTRSGQLFFEAIKNICILKNFFFQNLTYVRPDRTNQRRVFTIYDDLEISKNMLSYPIHNVQNAEDHYYRRIKNNMSADNHDWDSYFNKHNFINKWLKILKICSEDEYFYVKKYAKHSCEGIIENISNKTIRNIADYGFGTNQLIALLLIISTSEKSTLLLEEPEINLHPDYQSKLAEILVDAYKCFGTHFVIETHSEYIIRKFQYLVAINANEKEPSDANEFDDSLEFTKDSIKIYYFHSVNGATQNKNIIDQIYINSDGRLTKEFGPGFLDESTKIIFDIWNLPGQN